jgi:hypothetical protein
MTRPHVADAIDTNPAVLNPRTGEITELAADTAELARYLADVRAWEMEFLRPAKRAVEEELLRRMDHEASYTLRAGGLEVTGDGPGRVEYDADVLRDRLRPLVDAGVISRDAFAAAVRERVSYQPMARGLNALRKLGGVVAEAVGAAERPSEKPRRVTVR